MNLGSQGIYSVGRRVKLVIIGKSVNFEKKACTRRSSTKKGIDLNYSGDMGLWNTSQRM